LDVRLILRSSALSETVEPVVGVTVNCRYLLPEIALAKVVPAKFVELYEFARGVGLIPAPRASVLVLRRVSVVVEAIVVSSPAFPCGSHARMTVSTNGAAIVVSVSGDKARFGSTS